MYLNNVENITNLWNHVCFLHPMNVLYGLQLFSMFVIKWTKPMGGWMTYFHRSFTTRKKKLTKKVAKNKKNKKSDLVC
jgi:hypothetical protein